MQFLDLNYIERENEREALFQVLHIYKLLLLYRWKTHKWRRCQLVPWTIRQDSPGAQETCGPGLQARGTEKSSSWT